MVGRAMAGGQSRSGSCLCGGVRFIGVGDWGDITYCHCGQCHKQTGHHYATTNIAMGDFQLLATTSLQWYESSEFAKRGFCNHCGSVLFWKPNHERYISVLIGAIDGDKSHYRAQKHIFIADKAPYYQLNDTIAKFDSV